MTPLVQHLRRVAFHQDAAGLTDGQLLERFLSRREEAAFEALVHRHGQMVLGVCRRVLHNGHDAEDAFQATFLVLVRKASSIAPRELVGSWLHGVAYRTALKARSLAARRRAKEQQVRAMPRSQSLDAGARADLQERLDLELSRLPVKYRAPVLLCDLEGKCRREAACLLGIAEGTLSSRLARARRLLARRLSGPDAVLSAGALAAAVSSSQAPAAVPVSLEHATVHIAMLLAAGSTAAAVASAEVAAITEGVLKTMLLTKLKTLTVCLLAVSVVALGIGALGQRLQAIEEPPALVAQNDDSPTDDDKPKKDKKDKKQKIENKIATPDQRAKAEEVLTKSFKTKAAPRVSVETFNGPITVTTGDKATVTAKVIKTTRAATDEAAKEALKSVAVNMTQEGDAIRIQAKTEDKLSLIQRAAAVELQTPPGAILDLHTSNGPVTISGVTGEIKVQTSNGKIDVKGSKAKLELKTSNGAIRVDGGAEQLNLHTSNGKITIQSGKGTVTAHTSNGGIEFSGTLTDGGHSFTTSNGSIKVTLPADARFRVDAQTSHGKIQTDFAIAESEKKGKTRLHTSVGDNPAVSIKLHTSNGSIGIHSKKDGKSEDDEKVK
jgi:RNA polymerase sigma factor (sigma-70 family)